MRLSVLDTPPDALLVCAARVDTSTTLTLLDNARAQRVLGKRVGAPVRVWIEDGRKRTLPQLRTLWGVVYPQVLAGLRKLAADVGEACPFATAGELHEAMKRKLLTREVIVPRSGEVLEITGSTTLLSVAEMSQRMLEGVCQWAAELGIMVEMPEERR